ncbi:class I glutamine amidotransferase-like protein [Trichoderma austrokoningii]
MLKPEPPKKFAIALFHGFQALDVFGPIDALNLLSFSRPLELCILAETMDPVSTVPERLPADSPIPNLPATGVIGESVVPSHTYKNAPEDIEVLLVPGGRGTRNLPRTQHVADFIKERFPKLRYLLTICTGASIAARSGVLDGKNATTNKMAFDWVVAQGPNVKWARRARWVREGNIWTSSGLTAGIDMMYAFIADQYGEEKADWIAAASEFTRNKDPTDDPFNKE